MMAPLRSWFARGYRTFRFAGCHWRVECHIQTASWPYAAPQLQPSGSCRRLKHREGNINGRLSNDKSLRRVSDHANNHASWPIRTKFRPSSPSPKFDFRRRFARSVEKSRQPTGCVAHGPWRLLSLPPTRLFALVNEVVKSTFLIFWGFPPFRNQWSDFVQHQELD